MKFYLHFDGLMTFNNHLSLTFSNPQIQIVRTRRSSWYTRRIANCDWPPNNDPQRAVRARA